MESEHSKTSAEIKYADIIHGSRPYSAVYPPMDRGDRAAQFAPFAALTGYEAAVEEQGQYFAYVDCRAADTIMVSTYDDTQNLKNSWGVTNHEPYIIDMGT